MSKFMTTILGIKILNRIDNAIDVQSILTKYGCIINTRIGLHENVDCECSTSGLILLEITDDIKEIEITNELKCLGTDDIKVRQMIF